jgi:hypothetical protein
MYFRRLSIFYKGATVNSVWDIYCASNLSKYPISILQSSLRRYSALKVCIGDLIRLNW